MQFFHLHNIFNWRGRWFFNWRGRWPLPNLGCWLLASLLLVSEVVHLVAFAFSTCSWNTSFSKFILIFWVFCHAWNNPFCYLVRGYDTCLSKENLKAYLRGWCNKTQPQVQYQIPSNTTLAGWQGSGPWSRQALRHFSQISRSLSLPLIWFVSLSPAASLTDAAAFWSTQTCPLQGETLKWPLKLHCNHTQLKTTRKCLPYASQPSVSVLVSWRWIIGKSGRAVPGQTSWVAVTLIAHVCDQICQSHSAVCPAVWQVFDAAQALERIKPFLNWLYLSPHATGALRTHQTQPAPTFLPLWTNELFLSKNVYSLLDHQRRLTEQQRPSRVSWTIKENKKRQSDLIPSSLAIAWGLRHDPDGPCLCFSV